MATANPLPSTLEIHPAAAERWPDPEALFGEKGAYREVGFQEVGRASETQLIMRCDLD